MQFPMYFNYQNFALIDAKLTDSLQRREMFTMQRHITSGKMQTYLRYKLISLIFFPGSQGIAQNTEKRKVDVFFITIAIVIPAVQLLTQNINKELRKYF